MKAKAVVFPDRNEVEVREVSCPEPGPGDAVVRVTHSWISNGTEGSFLRGERIQGDTAYRDGDPHPFPIVAGYQKIGVVEAVGEQITDLAVGQLVFCAMGKVDGMFHPMGGQISPSVSPRSQIWTLPDASDPVAFAGLVLTQVGYNCGTRPHVGVGDAAVVIGDGMVGHWAAQTLAWRGADVVLVGHHNDRLARFRTGPMRHVLNAGGCADWVHEVMGILKQPVQVIVDTVGSIAAIEQIMPRMRRFGHVVSAGFYGTDDLLSLQPLRNYEASVDLVSGWQQQRMDETLTLIHNGGLETLPLITHRFSVDRAAAAWRLIESKSEPVLGVILEW